ncbi:hypothetical protein [Maricaulis sp.]|uniref:hypothetical protein n=1 Tax=Maricaulis sp. TaxID=1486257 RepID=UPI00260964E8|nr:hypothetical protein [Maricaulis sp.]
MTCNPFTMLHRAGAFIALLGTIIAISTVPALAQGAPTQALIDQLNARGELIEKLQAGGYVMLIRHERTEVPSRADDYAQAPGECRAQRNLSVAGIASAQETGVNLRALGIETARVISSPMCRSTETARFVFGVGYETDLRLLHHDPRGERNLDVATAEMLDLLSELAPEMDNGNIALISHGGTIFRVTGLLLSEGETVVLRLDENGGFTVEGHFMGGDFGRNARMAIDAG